MSGRDVLVDLTLDTIGAKTGQRRTVSVMGIPDDGGWLVAGTAAGRATDPAWAHNVRANPDFNLRAGADWFAVHAEELEGSAQMKSWHRFTSTSSTYASIELRTVRRFPIFRLCPR